MGDIYICSVLSLVPSLWNFLRNWLLTWRNTNIVEAPIRNVIFVVWPHGAYWLYDFFNHTNNPRHSIQFTVEIESESTFPFGGGGENLLLPNTNHKPSLGKNFISSQKNRADIDHRDFQKIYPFCELDLCGSGYGPVADSCVHSNENLGYIKGGKFD
jgi:hypothetical protein